MPCDEFYNAGIIDIDCGDPIPSAAPSISLVPSSSSAPTLFPDCSCEPGQFKFDLELKTDLYPGDTSWEFLSFSHQANSDSDEKDNNAVYMAQKSSSSAVPSSSRFAVY